MELLAVDKVSVLVMEYLCYLVFSLSQLRKRKNVLMLNNDDVRYFYYSVLIINY